MKVYVVTDGQYSDYHICGVFSSREKAERAQVLHATHNDIEEFEIDELPESPEGMLSYEVTMSRDGEKVQVLQCSVKDAPEEGWIPDNHQTRQNSCETAFFSMWAKDEKHAVKIANERRIVALASGEWRAIFDEDRERFTKFLEKNK